MNIFKQSALDFLKNTRHTDMSSDELFKILASLMKPESMDILLDFQVTDKTAVDVGVTAFEIKELKILLEAREYHIQLLTNTAKDFHKNFVGTKRRVLELERQLTKAFHQKSDVEDRFALLADQYQEISGLVTGIYKLVDLLVLSGKVSEQTKKPELQSVMKDIQRLINAFDNKK
jgi:hypothetical protein